MRILIALGMCLSLLPAPAAWAAPSQPAQELVEKTAQKMIAKLKQEKSVIDKDPSRIYALVNQIVLPHFDFEYMSQLVLAKYWRDASDAQKKAFVEEFRTLLVRTYASSLNKYSDQKINYFPSRNGAEGVVLVRTEVEQPGGMPIPIDYRLHEKDGAWKVFDVLIDNVSLVTNYRSSFTREIRQGGLDGLIKTLKQKNNA